MDNYYSWEDVVNITKNAGGRIYALPFGNYENSHFELETICIDDIPKHYFTLEECINEGYDEDEAVIIRLINAYQSGSDVPPIILDRDLNVIDGSHRLGALVYLNYAYIKVFIELEN